MNKPENILIVRTDRIGDVVLTLPLAGIIKKYYPGCRVTFLVNDYTKELPLSNKYVDEVITIKMKNGKVKFKNSLAEIRNKNFDYAIVVFPKFIIALLVFFSGIKFTIGSGYRWYSFLFTKKIYEHRKYAEKHELEYNVNLLKEIGIKEDVNPVNIKFDIEVNDDALNEVNLILKNYNPSGTNKIVIIHPGSGGSSVDLPLAKFREIIQLILSLKNVTVVLTGTETEKEICESLTTDEKILNLAGKLSINQLIALISISQIFIANSTGPLHIAAALNVFVIGFYPKVLSCSAKRWGPYTEKSIVFTPNIDCNNCTVEQCRKLNCLNSIDVGRVFEQVEIRLKN